MAKIQLRSISDDDLCSVCRHCDYEPGDSSSCVKNWPGVTNPDGYITRCVEASIKFKRLEIVTDPALQELADIKKQVTVVSDLNLDMNYDNSPDPELMVGDGLNAGIALADRVIDMMENVRSLDDYDVKAFKIQVETEAGLRLSFFVGTRTGVRKRLEELPDRFEHARVHSNTETAVLVSDEDLIRKAKAAIQTDLDYNNGNDDMLWLELGSYWLHGLDLDHEMGSGKLFLVTNSRGGRQYVFFPKGGDVAAAISDRAMA
jgi:hypothetical protein